jgi:hypothetical protein
MKTRRIFAAVTWFVAVLLAPVQLAAKEATVTLEVTGMS